MNARLPFFNYGQLNLDIHNELIVDCFAGGGGNSLGIERATGRRVDIAINHDEDALSMHAMNHPETLHLREDIRDVDPRLATGGRPVGLLHLSPDCRDHSQSRGGQPRRKEIRGLAWQTLKWTGTVQPRVCTVENVKQITRWGPLIARRDKDTGRVMRLDGSVAAPGERVPLQQQFLIPDPKRAGNYWRKFVAELRRMGYAVDWKILVAANLGVPTTRERLFMVARRDAQAIVWPTPTHSASGEHGKKKWRPAADCIDWSIPCPSIFARKKDLADATHRRIAKGVKRFVLDNANPFIVPLTHHGSDRVYDIGDPLRTVTTAHRGEMALVNPSIIQIAHYSGRDVAHDLADPLRTITAATKGGEFAMMAPVLVKSASPAGDTPPVVAYLAQQNGGFNETPGHALTEPVSTITNRGSQQQLVAAHLATLRRNCVGRGADEPLPTITAGAEHHALVETSAIQCDEYAGLTEEQKAAALRVADFLIRYGVAGRGAASGAIEDAASVRDRLALVTISLAGIRYVIVDLTLRMLSPRELYAAQGFSASYIIDHGHDGRRFSKSAQVRMVGNSVCPPITEALIAANLPELCIRRQRKAA